MKLLVLVISAVVAAGSWSSNHPILGVREVTHTYEARIRVAGKVSTTQVQASDAGQAKRLVGQLFPGATVLSVRPIN